MNEQTIPLPNIDGRNDRFSYAKVHQDGQELFLKSAKNPELAQNLHRELLWSDYVNYVAAKEPGAHIRGPRIVGFNKDGGLLMEYIEAPSVASRSDGEAWKSKIDRYARTLSVLDKYAKDYSVEWPTGQVNGLDDIDVVWQRWFKDRYEDNSAILDKALDIIMTHKQELSYCVQHGDLTPWQMFEQGEDWIIYDGEKAGDHLPQYNDLAYGYGRLFTRLKDGETAAELLEKFMAYRDVDYDNFSKQFRPIMTFRATGMLADAYNDREHEDYIDQAHELLGLCFNGDLKDFLKTGD